VNPSPDHIHAAAVLGLLCSPGGSVILGRVLCCPGTDFLVFSDFLILYSVSGGCWLIGSYMSRDDETKVVLGLS